MNKRRLSDETFVELVMAASEALLEKGKTGGQLSDWVLDIVELLQERATLRDQFAAKAMPACYAEYCTHANAQGYDEDWKVGVALDAYAMADAMLKARGEGK